MIKAVNIRGFRAFMNPRFEGGIRCFMEKSRIFGKIRYILMWYIEKYTGGMLS